MQRSGFLIVHTRRIAYRLNGIIHRRILVARTPAIVCAMAPTRRQVSSLASSAVSHYRRCPQQEIEKGSSTPSEVLPP